MSEVNSRICSFSVTHSLATGHLELFFQRSAAHLPRSGTGFKIASCRRQHCDLGCSCPALRPGMFFAGIATADALRRLASAYSNITSSHQRASLAAMLFSTSLLGNNDKIPPLQQSCRGTRRSGIFGIYSLYYTCILALATDLFRITANLQRTTIVYCLFLVTSFLISYIQRIALPSASDSSRSHIPRACVENSFCMNGK